jgi:DNA-binding response OmpR family regulator
MRVAVLDDDKPQADLVCRTLSDAGYQCQTYQEGRKLVEQLRRDAFDLLVLDWNVPDLSGEDVLRWVRHTIQRRLPVLFLTHRARESDMASILNLGADDYIVKPASASILLARVGAIMRRTSHHHRVIGLERFGEFEFDLEGKRIFVRGTVVAVTQKEFELALLLFQNMGRPLSRMRILEVIWKQRKGESVASRSMDTHVSVLRAKLGLKPEHGYRLAPIYGFGYRLERVKQGAF